MVVEADVLQDRCPSYLTAGQAGQRGIPQHQLGPVFRKCDLNRERNKDERRKQAQQACPEAAVKTGRGQGEKANQAGTRPQTS